MVAAVFPGPSEAFGPTAALPPNLSHLLSETHHENHHDYFVDALERAPTDLRRLARACGELRAFLIRVHFEPWGQLLPRGSLYFPTDSLRLAVERYVRVWMPLLARRQTEQRHLTSLLAPPLDVQWVHHLHRLDPTAYARDCVEAFGEIVDPAGGDPFIAAPVPRSSGAAAAEAEAEARRLWALVAPEGWHFDLEKHVLEEKNKKHNLRPRSPSAPVAPIMSASPSALMSPPPSSPSPSLAKASGFAPSVDLVAKAGRQSTFLWSVWTPNYEDDAFLLGACERYAALCHLWRLHPRGVFLVPTYDMDLAWHAHQSFPSAYAADMERAVGRVVGHDDTDADDRAKGGTLDRGASRTAAIWAATFPTAEPWAKEGGMWRGHPPNWYWTASVPRAL